MSRTQQRWAFILILIFTVVLAACQPAATPTPTTRPTDTSVPPTEVSAATEEMTEAASALETEAAALPTEEMTSEMMATEAATMEMMATEESTMEVAMLPTVAMTSEMMPTEEATMEMTMEATAELGTIVDVAEADGNFSILLAALDKAGLTDTLSGEGPFTVFAPTDDAFKKLLDDNSMSADELLDRKDLADILLYHVVSGSVTADELENFRSTDNPDLIVVPTMLDDKTLDITFNDDGTAMINGEAEVTLTNVEASNGVIHVIDTVLMPPSDMTEAPMMEMTEAPMMEMPEATEAPMMEMTAEATMEMMSEMGPNVMVSPDNDIVIGLAVGLSGEGIAPLGIDIQRGAELALEDRPTVTVDGVDFTVSLDVQDDQCSADGGQAVANRFASDGSIVGVVGPMCSSACRAAAPIFDAADYTSISPSCTAADLTTSGYSSFNRSVVSDAFQGVIAAEYIYNVLGLHSIATIHDGSTYGEGLVSVLTDRFEQLGGEVVSSDAVSVGDTDFRGLLDDIAQTEPELIYFAGFPAEGSRLLEQRADAGLEDVPFMSADGVAGTEVVDLAGDSAEGMYATKAIAADSTALSDFLDRYVSTYGEEPPAPYHANGYDAVNILLDAIESVGYVDDNGDLVVLRSDVQNYVRTLSDFQGLTGVLNATDAGETSVADIGIFQVMNGVFTQVYTGSVVDGDVVLTPYEAPMMDMTEEATMEMMPTEEIMATEAAPMMEMTAEATEAS